MKSGADGGRRGRWLARLRNWARAPGHRHRATGARAVGKALRSATHYRRSLGSVCPMAGGGGSSTDFPHAQGQAEDGRVGRHVQ